MKLRNKISGEIKKFALFDGKELQGGATLEDLTKEWEDYEPAEPLIKNEKIRKAVRAWAEANEIEACLYDAENFSLNTDGYCISFKTGFAGKTKLYTIDELCGEEEE